MVIPLLIIRIAFFYTHVERESSLNHARPRTIFTTRHPSYPSIGAYVTHMTLDTRLPLLSRVLKKKVEPGDEATPTQSGIVVVVLVMYVHLQVTTSLSI